MTVVSPVNTIQKRFQPLDEETVNSISHGIGLALAVVGAAVLVGPTLRSGSAGNTVGVTVFASTMVLLYLASTVYHALGPGSVKQIFRMLDHGAIFLLIAGTYTPFTLGIMRGPWGWILLCLVWALAFLGVAMKAVMGARHLWFSVALYLIMGWLAVIAVEPVLMRVPLPGILWLLAGGLAYTSGLGFFAARRLRYSHFVWHLFVIVGTTCHFFAVLWYSA